MNFTHFHQIFLQQGIFHCSRSNRRKYANTEKARLDRVVIAKQCLLCLIQRKTCLEHGFAIEFAHFH